jgi:hypothetical protein
MTMTRGNAIGFAVTLDGGGTCEFICDRALTQRDYERLQALCHEFLEDVRRAAQAAAINGKARAIAAG